MSVWPFNSLKLTQNLKAKTVRLQTSEQRIHEKLQEQSDTTLKGKRLNIISFLRPAFQELKANHLDSCLACEPETQLCSKAFSF